MEPVLREELIAMLETVDCGSLRGRRDCLCYSSAFAGGLRRSEIAGLYIARNQKRRSRPEGVLVTLCGKTGWREVEISRSSSDATSPVVARQTWLKLSRSAMGKIPPRGRTGQNLRRGAAE
jgi:hypothetical protein